MPIGVPAHLELRSESGREQVPPRALRVARNDPRVLVDPLGHVRNAHGSAIANGAIASDNGAGASSGVSEPQPSEEALRESEERFRGAFDHSPIGMGIVGLDGRFERVNRALCRIGGYSEDELLSRSFQDVVPEDELEFHREQAKRLLHGEIESYEREVRYRHKLGHFVWVRFAVSAIRGRDGRVIHLLGQAEDVSARKEAEGRLRQAERLEAVGRLAGGVAHEFNNLLAVIGGFARHAQDAAGSDTVRRDLAEIVNATDRAAEIARQLLAFSRDEPSRPTMLDVSEVVRGMEPMLRSLIREDVEVVVSIAEELPCVHVDRTQLERVILNLVVNARDAIDQDGRIEIAARAVELDAATTPLPQLQPGSYVALCVSDTGSGIDPDARQRLFDPFFTTKDQGEGTGLGLSIVYGIVEELAGAVVVESEPGQGATFTVYIPATEGEPAARQPSGQPERAAVTGGTETILVVEDEGALRSLLELILSESGYRVLTAADGEEALAIIDRVEPDVDLVLTDSIMPKVGGAELVRRLESSRPTTRVIQMTGYMDRSLGDSEVIAKPFEAETLLRRVRDVLDRRL
jgi:two-component system, cell cycle sensor histidine kinase and response regulator CckA